MYLTNLKFSFTRDMLTAILDAEGFNGLYDFVHVPVNFQDMTNLSYALVNLVDNAAARRGLQHLDALRLTASHSCSASWSTPSQGLEAHVERYRNSPMMHESVPAQHRPALYRSGREIAFPPATKHIRAPRIRHPKMSQHA